MPKLKIKATEVGTIRALKKSLKKGDASSYLTRIPDTGITVRFATEPDKWVKYLEHYSKDDGYHPCADDCDSCREGGEVARKSQRYLTNAINIEDNKMIPLVLPKSLAGSLFKKYERYGTMIDRDYELSKDGTGFDTVYDFEALSPERMRLSRYEPIDLLAALEAQLPSDEDDEEEDEDDEPKSTKRGIRPQTKSTVVRSKTSSIKTRRK